MNGMNGRSEVGRPISRNVVGAEFSARMFKQVGQEVRLEIRQKIWTKLADFGPADVRDQI
jgi:ABC-type transport system involved in cytochrome bd biosynthesis fused ATPase/permease subunit